MPCASSGQTLVKSQAELEAIASLDAALFDSYDRCDLEKFGSFFFDDVEFYHEQGGVTLGKVKLTDSYKKEYLRQSDPRARSRDAAGPTHPLSPRHRNENTMLRTTSLSKSSSTCLVLAVNRSTPRKDRHDPVYPTVLSNLDGSAYLVRKEGFEPRSPSEGA